MFVIPTCPARRVCRRLLSICTTACREAEPVLTRRAVARARSLELDGIYVKFDDDGPRVGQVVCQMNPRLRFAAQVREATRRCQGGDQRNLGGEIDLPHAMPNPNDLAHSTVPHCVPMTS